MRDFNTEEVLVVGVLIKVPKYTEVPDKYKCVFHGKTQIVKGSYVYWYPIKSPAYSRIINELQRWYGMKVEYGIAGSVQI